nr:MAG TPA: hypothetical protein [Caudoviricetes sp.]
MEKNRLGSAFPYTDCIVRRAIFITAARTAVSAKRIHSYQCF